MNYYQPLKKIAVEKEEEITEKNQGFTGSRISIFI